MWVRNKADLYGAMATTLTSEERAERWSGITDRFSFYAEYQDGIEREIPVVRLRRS